MCDSSWGRKVKNYVRPCRHEGNDWSEAEHPLYHKSTKEKLRRGLLADNGQGGYTDCNNKGTRDICRHEGNDWSEAEHPLYHKSTKEKLRRRPTGRQRTGWVYRL